MFYTKQKCVASEPQEGNLHVFHLPSVAVI